ncbi:hypothetical protein BDF14DRAFT_886143 [Spinellus fusiger]|nr:hypothetical protein BDF14DRAFT_886143 [Spinellus fusiger]
MPCYKTRSLLRGLIFSSSSLMDKYNQMISTLVTHSGVPEELQPDIAAAIRAYSLGWSMTTVPGLVTLLIKVLLARVNKDRDRVKMLLKTLLPLLRHSLTHNGFPFVTAGVFSSYKVVSFVLRRVFHLDMDEKKERINKIITTASVLWLGRTLFPSMPTLDMTLTVFSRAVDVVGYSLHDSPWAQSLPWWWLEYSSVTAFTAVTSEVLFTWIYDPTRLPRSYAKWISNIGSFDERILVALRAMRTGDIVYGVSG